MIFNRSLICFLNILFFHLGYSDDTIIDEETIDLSHLGTQMYGSPDEEVGEKLNKLSTDNDLNMNPEEIGSYIEGDILIPRPLGRNGVLAEFYRWSNGVVPFEIKGSFSANEMSLIEAAINEYHKNTCIKFTPRTGDDNDYISFQNSASGCWSSVGRVGGGQVLNLQSPGCLMKVGTVMHEMMHAIGFLHEQNREECEGHLSIQFQNVQKGTEANFAKAPKGTTSGFGVGYDYGSVMHYSSNAFSVNGQPTIVAKNNMKESMGQREGFSPSDIKKIWKMYNCKSTASAGGHKPEYSSAIDAIPNAFNEIMNVIFPSGDEEEIQ